MARPSLKVTMQACAEWKILEAPKRKWASRRSSPTCRCTPQASHGLPPTYRARRISDSVEHSTAHVHIDVPGHADDIANIRGLGDELSSAVTSLFPTALQVLPLVEGTNVVLVLVTTMLVTSTERTCLQLLKFGGCDLLHPEGLCPARYFCLAVSWDM